MGGLGLAAGSQIMMAALGLVVGVLLGGLVLWQHQGLGVALVPWIGAWGCGLAATVGLWLMPPENPSGPAEIRCLEPGEAGRLQLRLGHGLVHLGSVNGGRSLGRFVASRGDAELGNALMQAQPHCEGAPWAVLRTSSPRGRGGLWRNARVGGQQFLWLDTQEASLRAEVYLGLPEASWNIRIDMDRGLIEKSSAAVKRLDVSLGRGRVVLFAPASPQAEVAARMGVGIVEAPDSSLARLEVRGGYLQATLAAPIPGLLQAVSGSVTLGDQLAMPVRVLLEGGAVVSQPTHRLTRQGSAWVGGPPGAARLHISLRRGKVEWQ